MNLNSAQPFSHQPSHPSPSAFPRNNQKKQEQETTRNGTGFKKEIFYSRLLRNEKKRGMGSSNGWLREREREKNGVEWRVLCSPLHFFTACRLPTALEYKADPGGKRQNERNGRISVWYAAISYSLFLTGAHISLSFDT